MSNPLIFAPVFKEGLPGPGNGIGGFDLKSDVDSAFAFDYTHSGKLDHIVLYRPGSGIIFIISNDNGMFKPVFQSDKGIGGYNLLSFQDQAFAYDFDHSGNLDHIVLYRPGNGIIWIIKNDNGTFRPVFQTGLPGNGAGIGGFDLLQVEDRALAYDYDHTGKQDYLVLYSPGVISIVINTNGNFGHVLAMTGEIGGYNLNSFDDKVTAVDYSRSNRLDYLALYRPTTGSIFILNNNAGDFTPVYQEPVSGHGIGGFDLKQPEDRLLSFDYDKAGRTDFLTLYRPGTGTIWMLQNRWGTFTPAYRQGIQGIGSGIGGYDLASPVDTVFAFDYDHSGKLDHFVIYRPGAGIIWILKNQGVGA